MPIPGKENFLKKITRTLCLMLSLVSLAQPLAIAAYAEDTTIPTETVVEDTPLATTPTEEVLEEGTELATEPVAEDSAELPEDLSIPEDLEETCYHNIPLFSQNDYPQTIYGTGTVANNGCGITCLAMVATYMTRHPYLPDELARYFGGRAENNIARLEYGSDCLQLPYYKATNWHETLAALENGKIAIALMGSDSIFTSGQHFIVLAGMTEDGKIMVNDPNEANYSHWRLKNGFENGFAPGDILCGYSGAWIYDPDAMPEEPFIYTEEREIVECRYPDVTLTWEEIQLLARVIWVEARGECAEGQQAVAEVVLNRLVSDNYADTLYGVIYAENQFNSVPFLDDAEPGQAQYEAIDRALYGPYILSMDVVKFANYIVNDDIWGQIGGHYFFFQC